MIVLLKKVLLKIEILINSNCRLALIEVKILSFLLKKERLKRIAGIAIAK